MAPEWLILAPLTLLGVLTCVVTLAAIFQVARAESSPPPRPGPPPASPAPPPVPARRTDRPVYRVEYLGGPCDGLHRKTCRVPAGGEWRAGAWYEPRRDGPCEVAMVFVRHWTRGDDIYQN